MLTVRLQAPKTQPAPTPRPKVPRVARLLALAHHWQGLIDAGAVADRADVARLVGVARARVSQVMALLWLSPELQEAVLGGEVDVDERVLREVARAVLWSEQAPLS